MNETRPPVGDAAHELLDLAPAYALDALGDTERREVEERLETAEPLIREQFQAMVREIHQTMAFMATSTAIEAPHHLRDRILAELPARADLAHPVSPARRGARIRRRLLVAVAAAAAVAVVAFGGITIGRQVVRTPPEPVPAQILAADDVRTSTAPISGGGSATVVFSRDVDAGVLVMTNVAPPAEGSVYQMWLLGPSHTPVSAGTMNAAAVKPSTTAVVEGIDQSTALGFSVEPPGGSPQPTGDIFATLPLD